MITMEMIDQFRKRTNCSYEEAKMYLERNNGDIVDAIVDFEKNHGKVKYEAKSSKFKDFFSKAYRTRLVVENNNTVILNLSLLFVGLFVLFTLRSLPIIIISFVIALLLDTGSVFRNIPAPTWILTSFSTTHPRASTRIIKITDLINRKAKATKTISRMNTRWSSKREYGRKDVTLDPGQKRILLPFPVFSFFIFA